MHLLTSTAVESSTQRPLFIEMDPAVAGKAPDFKTVGFFRSTNVLCTQKETFVEPKVKCCDMAKRFCTRP